MHDISLPDTTSYEPRREKTCLWGLKVSLKPFSSANETSKKIEISPVLSFSNDTFEKSNNKGADQSARMCRLVCAFVVRKLQRQDFWRHCPYDQM